METVPSQIRQLAKVELHLHLEICPSCNAQLGLYRGLGAHPYWSTEALRAANRSALRASFADAATRERISPLL